MPNQAIYLTDENLKRLRECENMSKVVNNLLTNYFNEIETPSLEELEQEEQEIIKKAELIKQKKKQAVLQEQLKLIEEHNLRINERERLAHKEVEDAKIWIINNGLKEDYQNEFFDGKVSGYLEYFKQKSKEIQSNLKD